MGGVDNVANVIGKSAASVRRYIAAETMVPALELVRLAEVAGVSVEWLFTGKSNESEGMLGDLIYVPLWDVRFSAGPGSNAGDNTEIVDQLPFSKRFLRDHMGVSPENVHFVLVSGDSMFPTLQGGDVVMIDTSQDMLVRDDVYALRHDGAFFIKRLQRMGSGRIRVISDNKDLWQAYEVDLQRETDFAIVGRYVCKLSSNR